jgi:hypothetical protein
MESAVLGLSLAMTPGRGGFSDPTPVVAISGSQIGGTGDITVVMPAHQTNDIIMLLVETANQAVATPAGDYNALVAVGSGVAADAAASRLSMFWKRAASAAETDIVVTDAGDHTVGRIVVVRGCPTSGTPVSILSSVSDSVAASPAAFATAATLVNNTLVMQVIATCEDAASSGQWAFTAAGLTESNKLFDFSSNSGNGGGFAVNTGKALLAGSIGITTAASAVRTFPQVMTRVTLAFVPA